MSDRPNHRAAAERMLADADEWTAQAGELNPEASELSCLAYGILHALLAIHDTLTAPDRYAANEARQREEAEPDPLDEDNHSDRHDAGGTRWARAADECWANGAHHVLDLTSLPGPLTFAPEAAQETPRVDPSASQDESGAVEGANTGDAQKAILCPECDHHINVHDVDGCLLTRCDCPRTPEDVARALIAEAAKPTWCPTCGHHRDDHRQDGCVPTCECAPVDIEDER